MPWLVYCHGWTIVTVLIRFFLLVTEETSPSEESKEISPQIIEEKPAAAEPVQQEDVKIEVKDAWDAEEDDAKDAWDQSSEDEEEEKQKVQKAEKGLYK